MATMRPFFVAGLPLALCSLLACSDDAGETNTDGDTGDEAGSSSSTGEDTGEEDTMPDPETSSGTDTDTDTDSDTGTDEGTDTGEGGNPLLSDEVLDIAHRGGGRLRPEATLLAFENALAVGADIIEMDIHSSADGVLVVIHDDTVDRTTDGEGAVHELSFDALRELDAAYDFTTDGGETFPYRGTGVQIPRIEEVFETFPDAYYLVEVKQSEPSIVADFVAILDEYAIGERIVVASFDDDTIEMVRALSPETFTAMSFDEMIEFQAALGDPDYAPPCAFVQPPWELTSPELVDFAHGLDLKVHPWTVNNGTDMMSLIAAGVDGIMTDDPELLAGIIAG